MNLYVYILLQATKKNSLESPWKILRIGRPVIVCLYYCILTLSLNHHLHGVASVGQCCVVLQYVCMGTNSVW